jgi:methionine synthase II (cobalamin-independent)
MKVTNDGAYPWRGTPLGDALERERGASGRRRLPSAARARGAANRVARQAVTAQAESRCDLVTDGWRVAVRAVAEGGGPARRRRGGPERGSGPGRFRVPIVRQEVAWKEPLLVEDFLFAAAGASVPVKVVLTVALHHRPAAEDRPTAIRWRWAWRSPPP